MESFDRLLKIMDELREECPWDRKQTLKSLRNLTIEETYELADAIVNDDMKGIKEELGDLLLHIVFYSKIADEKNAFNVDEVINTLCEKLIHRHPHIYGDLKLDTEEEVKANWEKIKMKDGKGSILEGVPLSLPALVKALRIQDKTKQVGFEWERVEQVWDKVEEEMIELKEAVVDNNKREIENEFGDLLFALVNYARFLDIDPELALERTNKKFITRFQFIEKKAAESNQELKTMTLDAMDRLWNLAKEEDIKKL